MINIVERNKVYIVIAIAVFCLLATVFYFTTKNRRIMTHIADLNDRIEELEEVLQNFDNNKIPLKNIPSSNMNTTIPSSNMNTNIRSPNINTNIRNPNINSPFNVSNNVPYENKNSIPSFNTHIEDPRHVTFNTHVEEIEEKEEISEEDLDAELEEELKDLEDETKNENNEKDIEDENIETDLKDDE